MCVYFTWILKQLSWTGWPKVLDYAILAGWRRNWTRPLPRTGSVNLFKFLLFFLLCFLFFPFVAFRWLRESPPALAFGHFSIAIYHLPISNAFPTYQFAIKILHFYLTPPSASVAARATSSPPRQTSAGAMEQQSSQEQPAVDLVDASEASVLPTQITSIDGFFNRKRGRPPKNRFVEVYKSVSRVWHWNSLHKSSVNWIDNFIQLEFGQSSWYTQLVHVYIMLVRVCTTVRCYWYITVTV